MDCEEIRELLPLCAGGELEEGERLAVESHLGFCAGCAGELDRYRQDRSRLADLREDEPPAGTWRALWAGIRRDLFPAPAAAVPRPRPAGSWRFAAALLAGLALGLAAHAVRHAGGEGAADPGPAPVAGLHAGSGGAIPAATPAGSRPAAPPAASPLRIRIEVGSPAPAKDRFHLPLVESFPPPDEREF